MVKELIYETEEFATEVLNGMYRLLHYYGIVQVADLYDLSQRPDITTNNDMLYGWKSLDEARIKQCDGGWEIKLPEVVKLWEVIYND